MMRDAGDENSVFGRQLRHFVFLLRLKTFVTLSVVRADRQVYVSVKGDVLSARG
jgi:hypothetical protein